MRDFDKERLSFQGIIPEYRIPDNNECDKNGYKKSAKQQSKDIAKRKRKHKEQNKHNHETTARIATGNRNGGYKR